MSEPDLNAFADAYVQAVAAEGVDAVNRGLLERFAASKDGVDVISSAPASCLDEFAVGFGCEFDADMIGNAFEKAITGWYSRGETGSYYTPEEIVEFMVEQTVHPRLLDRLDASGSDWETVDDWMVEATPAAADAALEELDALTVCDPACGSGHFLVGALDEIVRLRRLFRSTTGDEQPDWLLARRTAEQNIYGVDILEEAVEIAKLRLRLRVLEDLPPAMAERYVVGEQEELVAAADGGNARYLQAVTNNPSDAAIDGSTESGNGRDS